MKVVITPTVTFNTTAATLDLSAYSGFDIHRLFAVIDLTTKQIIYAVGTTGLGYSSISGSVLTLQSSMSGLASTDVLQIIYDDPNAGSATSALQTTGNGTLVSILAACQAPTPAGSAVIGAVTQSGNWIQRLSDGIGNLISSVTQGSRISLSVQNVGRTIVSGSPIRNDYTVTSVTTTAYVQLIASTSAVVNRISIFDSSGQTLALATGAAGSEIIQLYIFPGGNGQEELYIPGGTRVAIKAVSGTASVGELDINFYQ